MSSKKKKGPASPAHYARGLSHDLIPFPRFYRQKSSSRISPRNLSPQVPQSLPKEKRKIPQALPKSRSPPPPLLLHDSASAGFRRPTVSSWASCSPRLLQGVTVDDRLFRLPSVLRRGLLFFLPARACTSSVRAAARLGGEAGGAVRGPARRPRDLALAPERLRPPPTVAPSHRRPSSG